MPLGRHPRLCHSNSQTPLSIDESLPLEPLGLADPVTLDELDDLRTLLAALRMKPLARALRRLSEHPVANQTHGLARHSA
jgi:hypothetical protein